MKAAAALLLLSMGGSSLSAATKANVLSVSDVKNDILALDGKNVMVRGWVKGCGGALSMCELQTSPDANDGPSLTLAYVSTVEKQLKLVAGGEVILKARVTDECTVNICTDRGPDLVPIRVIKVF